MSNIDFKSDEEKENTAKDMHTIVSLIYILIILVNSLIILWSLAYSSVLAIAVVWTIASIIISKILINNKNISLAYRVLFSAPVVTCLLIIQETINFAPYGTQIFLSESHGAKFHPFQVNHHLHS
ncbi:MAG TPA: hypothetical protein DIW23_03455 [Anaerolineae bacterium]|nr:hypothetical protein [Anaerolineae bacterium]